jgi:O-6-methylguanine DNA methyltransferase
MPIRNPKFTLPIPTRLGIFVAEYSATGLCGLSFPKQVKSWTPKKKTEIPATVRSWHATAAKAVASALNGKQPLKLPPLDLSAGTEFQQQVWRALRRIRPARTLSYSEVASALGRPGAARAVGGACGANPIPVLVPCHRVLAANRKIGGFSGGLDWKRSLLEIEGVRPAD